MGTNESDTGRGRSLNLEVGELECALSAQRDQN